MSSHGERPYFPATSTTSPLLPSICLSYTPPDLSENIEFDTKEMRKVMDGHNLEDRDWLFGLMIQGELFCRRVLGNKVFVSPDYNQSMKQQREMTMKRIGYLMDRGVFDGWLTNRGVDADMKKFAYFEVLGMYDHSLAVKLGVHFFLWGGAVQFFGTQQHHEKWLSDTEKYVVKGCFRNVGVGTWK